MTHTRGPETLEWTVSDRLRKARESAGLGVSELAAEIGISRRTVSRYEGGARPSKSVLLLWNLRTGAPVEWILTGKFPSAGVDELERRRSS